MRTFSVKSSASQKAWKDNKPAPEKINDEFKIEDFQVLEEMESNLYRCIFSFQPLHNFLLNLFEEYIRDKDSDFRLSDWKRDAEQIIQARHSDTAKAFGRSIHELLKNQVQNRSELKEAISFPGFEEWRSRVVSLHEEMYELKNKIARDHLGLIKYVSAKMNRRKLSLAEEDLQQEGYFGLLRAIEKFDYKKGYRFSTYAVWWLNHAMRRYIDNTNDMVRVPVLTNKHRMDIRKFKKKYFEMNKRSPTLEEIRQHTGLTLPSLELAMNRFVVSSLDQKIGKDINDTANLHDLLEDDHDFSKPDEVIQRENVKGCLQKALNRLSTKERKIIMERFCGEEELTLQQVGERIDLSRERVRQLQDQALKKLRVYLGKTPF